MYEISPEWADYYRITDPEKRKKFAEDAGTDELTELRTAIYKARYHRDADYFIRCMVEMQVTFGSFSTGRGAEKAIRKSLKLLTLDGREIREEEKALLYWEIRNAAMRYLETTTSPEYGRKLLGLMNSSADEKKMRAVSDIWQMTEGARQKIERTKDPGLAADMDFYVEAVLDAYRASEDDAPERLRRFERKKG